MSARDNLTSTKRTAKQFLLLGLPYLLTFLALACFAYIGSCLLQQKLSNSFITALFNAPELTVHTADTDKQYTFSSDQLSIDDLPIFQWGERWATLSVDELPDAAINNAPVYVGDNPTILKKGVGKYFGSCFCGEGGKIVLDAHVTKAFSCLEDMKIGYTVRVHTVYGEYVYRVKNIFLFEADDSQVVTDRADTEQLLLYTCYPRRLSYRRQRIGIVCTKVSGADFR